jgi:hydroxyethylthiazole kinase
MSELKTLADGGCNVSGVDADPKDVFSEENADETIRLAKSVAETYGAVVLASGKTDLVTDGSRVCLIQNGSDMMGRITGTGCMLNVLTAAYMSVGEPFEAAVAACIVFGISGELAVEHCAGPGSFQPAFQDALYNMKDDDLRARVRADFGNN